jgi:hypothetical protein
MLSTRRFFASILPAIPFAGAATQSGFGSPPPIPDNPTMTKYAWKEAGAQLIRTAAPPAMKQYMAAQEALNRSHHHKYQIRELTGFNTINPNIQALKSVSAQHKLHMHIKKQEDERKQEQSFMSALAESLGLKEFLERQNTQGVPATGPAPQAY